MSYSSNLRLIAFFCCAGTPPKRESPKKKRVSEEDMIGAKSKLYSVLKQSTQPLSSAEIWETAEVMQEPTLYFLTCCLCPDYKQAALIRGRLNL